MSNNSKRSYSIAMYDDDIGNIIWRDDSLLYSDFLNKLNEMLSSYSPYDEVIQDEKFHADMKQWNPSCIIDMVEQMEFFGGLVELNIWYPGHHRQIQIRLM